MANSLSLSSLSLSITISGSSMYIIHHNPKDSACHWVAVGSECGTPATNPIEISIKFLINTYLVCGTFYFMIFYDMF